MKTDKFETQDYSFRKAVLYKIVIQGEIDTDWSKHKI